MRTRTDILSALVIVASFIVSCTEKPAQPVNPEPVVEQPDPQSVPWPEEGMENKLYLNNGKIQIGIDLDMGGVIFHFSEVTNKTNMLNHYDAGRNVQQSYYGNADGSMWSGKQWKYNPIQGGGWAGGFGSVEESKNDSTLAWTYQKTVPVHWATMSLLDECRMEQTVYLKGKIAKIHYKFTYNGTTINNTADQELPAFFVNWNYYKLAWYAGTKPWSGEDLTVIEVPVGATATGTKIAATQWTEKWAAFLDKEGWGIGVYSPSSSSATYYRVGDGKSCDSSSSSCSYIAPLGSFALSPGFTYEYDVFITCGTAGQIRNNFAGQL